MRSVGIIAEFNPFHSGHLHLIKKTKELFPHDAVICVMSGDFVQRGTPAVFSKYERARIAVNAGADIVLELPFPFSSSCAEIFAGASVNILKNAGISSLIFGSECGDISALLKIAEKSLNAKENFGDLDLRGASYADRLSAVLSEKDEALIRTPNNLLGVEYIKALKGTDITPHTIKRLPDISAHKIRESGDYSSLPFIVSEKPFDYDGFSRAALFKIRTMSKKELRDISGMSEGLENRIYDCSFRCDTLESLCEMIKTKRYTLARLRRTLLYCALSVKQNVTDRLPSYLRVLAFGNKGRSYMKEHGGFILKTASAVLSEKDREIFEFNATVSDAYRVFGGSDTIGRADYVKSPIYIKGED